MNDGVRELMQNEANHPERAISDGAEMYVPVVYRSGHQRARLQSRDLADLYVAHIVKADPIADAAIAALSDLEPEVVHRFIAACVERDVRVLREAPRELRDFFDCIESPPNWFYSQSVLPGCRAFHTNLDLLTLTFVVASGVEGFGSLIAKAFFATGRLTDFGAWRARQVLRHLVEVMMPDGLERDGEGWKLTVRIRLVHAQVRRQMNEWDGWNVSEEGVPISTAHVALASAIFSARCLESAERLGAVITDEERASFMHIWRYTAWLLGTPEQILFRDYDEALALCGIGLQCEPPVGLESVAMANAFINSIPRLGGVTGTAERQAMAKDLYKLSRALIGDELADRFKFPVGGTRGLVPMLRWKRQIGRWVPRLARFIPGNDATLDFEAYLNMVRADEMGLSYRLPQQLYSDERTNW